MLRTYFREFKDALLIMNREDRNAFWAILAILFLVLFSYPIIRSVADVMFIESFGAKNSPLIWTLSIIALSGVIAGYSRWQARLSVKGLFIWTTVFSILVLEFSYWRVSQGDKYWAFPLFIWKECYIVLLFHLMLGYLNSVVSSKVAKLLYGPITGLTSLGGVLGGLLTSQLTRELGVAGILWVGTGSLALCIAFTSFICKTKPEYEGGETHSELTPLQAVKSVRTYVIILVAAIMLTQFVISIANLKFYLLLEQMVTDPVTRTSYLGGVYTAVNVISVICQFFIVPWLLYKFSNKSIQIGIPIFNLLIAIFGFFIFGALLFPVAAAFALYKGIDYSVFGVSKELLYFPLSKIQRYGAKYLVDIIGSRFGKSLISIFLIFVQNAFVLNILLISFLAGWLMLIFPLCKEQEKIPRNN